MVGVCGALIPAGLAGLHAGLELGTGDVRVVAGVPREHSCCGLADVGAVEVGPDALAQVGDLVFTQAGVRTGGAGLGAGEEGVHGAGEEVAVQVYLCLGRCSSFLLFSLFFPFASGVAGVVSGSARVFSTLLKPREGSQVGGWGLTMKIS